MKGVEFCGFVFCDVDSAYNVEEFGGILMVTVGSGMVNR